MRPIQEIASALGLDKESIVPYGHYKAKIPLDSVDTSGNRGRLIVVTGITPTRAGEGKTTVTVGLTQGLGKLGERVIATLREPSLGPIFGIKGGGTGGGKTTVMPDDEINIHFTGDAHAVGSAHNLLAALTDKRCAARSNRGSKAGGHHLETGHGRRGPGPAHHNDRNRR